MPTKVCLVQPMVFSVVMYGCESWTIKKAEHWRIDAFERWCWRRLLRVPWTARRSSQSILKEISPGCSLEGLMLMLKLQYIGHPMWRADSFEKTLMLGKIEGRRRRDNRGWNGWMPSLTQWTWVWVNPGSWRWTERPGVLQSMELQSQTWLSDWTEMNWWSFKNESFQWIYNNVNNKILSLLGVLLSIYYLANCVICICYILHSFLYTWSACYWCFQSSSMLQNVSQLYSFLWLNHIPL